MMRSIVFLLFILLALTSCTVDAISTYQSDTELILGSDAIVYGTISDVSSRWNAAHTNIETTAQVRILDTFKDGSRLLTTGETVPVTIFGGTVGDTTQWVEDSPAFLPDADAVMLLKKKADGRFTIYGATKGVTPIITSPMAGSTAINVDTPSPRGNLFRQSPFDIAAYKQKVRAVLEGTAAKESVPAVNLGIPDFGAGSGLTSGTPGGDRPVIESVSFTNVNPTTASAGTNTIVTITGSGFGTKASRTSLADIAFLYRTDGTSPYIWASGYPLISNSNDIISWSNTQIRVYVPIGITEDGYPGSACSGFLGVVTDSGEESSLVPFTVTFGYGKEKWNAPVTYYVNPGSVAGSETAIQNAAATWKNAIPGSPFTLNYGGLSGSTTFGKDGKSLIYFGPSSDFPDPSTIAWATHWSTGGYITEADIEFNTGWTWTTGSASGSTMNVETIALHEMGHWLALRDLYGFLPEAGYPGYPSDISPEKKVMFGYNGDFFGNNNLKSLSTADTAGIRWIYTAVTPAISTVTPPSGYRNSTIPFTLTGSGFLSGATVNLVRAGYGPIPCGIATLTSARITGDIPLAADQQTGAWGVELTNPGGSTVTKPNAFTINTYPAPLVTGITPLSGYRNNTISFTLTGMNFQPGSVVNLSRAGYGNLTASLITITATQITGTVALPADVPTGQWNVNVTTKDGGEKGKINGFTVNNYPAPAVTGVTPLSGYRNNTISFTLTGSNFQQGTVVNLTRADYGNITAALNSLSASQISGTFTLPAGIPTGLWNVNVTTRDGGEKGKVNGFTVSNYPAPAVTSITPLSGYRNNSVSFTLTGSNFQQGAVVNLSRAGYGNLTASLITITATQITGMFEIPVEAPTGTWNVNVTTKDGGEKGRLNGFTVNNFPAPAVTVITPLSWYRNNSVSFTLTGSNFQPGAVVNLSRAAYGNITATTSTITATQITGSFAIPAGAPTGTWNVNVTTKDGGEKGKLNGFTVNNFPAPAVMVITPLSGYRNNSVSFTLTGSYFQPGSVVNLSRAGYGNLTASLIAITATQITGMFEIPVEAPTGQWNVNVTTKDGGEKGKVNGFTVSNYPAPTVTTITPLSGYRNNSVSFTLTGSNFQPGAVVNLSRAAYGNITATTGTITAMQITGSFTIPAGAPTGTWNVNVTTKDGGEKGKLNGFTVNNFPAPAVMAITPLSGYRNNSVSFTLYGSNFQPGAVVNLSRAAYGNITATTGTITAMQITGSFTIPAGAPTGTWNVNVTTKDGGEKGRLNGFTVNNFPAPLVTTITPATGRRDSTVPFTLTGNNFQPGSVVNLSRTDYGNITAAPGTITATRITGSFAIPAIAPTGMWNVNVTTKDGGEKGRLNGFTVTGP